VGSNILLRIFFSKFYFPYLFLIITFILHQLGPAFKLQWSRISLKYSPDVLADPARVFTFASLNVGVLTPEQWRK